MRDVRLPGCRFIIGRRGIGKTALVTFMLSSEADADALTLGINVPLPERDPPQQGAGPLGARLLCRALFYRFWEQALRDSGKRSQCLPDLRRDRRWMETIRRFHVAYPPLQPEIEEEFEFMEWLHALSPEDNPLIKLSPAEQMAQLLWLITLEPNPPDFGRLKLERAYKRVKVLVDGVERLPASDMRRLFDDAQALYHLNTFDLKLFADDVWRDGFISKLDCVREERVPVTRLEDWDTPDLRTLLRHRVSGVRPGLPPNTELSSSLDTLLSDWLDSDMKGEPPDQEDLKIRGELETLIVEKAKGSPLHALHLARLIVGECARRYASAPKKKLRRPDVEKLIEDYRKTRAKEGVAKE